MTNVQFHTWLKVQMSNSNHHLKLAYLSLHARRVSMFEKPNMARNTLPMWYLDSTENFYCLECILMFGIHIQDLLIGTPSAWHSSFWQDFGQPVKRVIIDECQHVNNSNLARHQALSKISTKARIDLSGILAHNKWHDLSGLIMLCRGYPIRNHNHFLGIFSAREVTGRADAQGINLHASPCD